MRHVGLADLRGAAADRLGCASTLHPEYVALIYPSWSLGGSLVAALLAGEARLRLVRRRGPGFLRELRQAWFGDVLVVPVSADRDYEQRVLYQSDGHGWVLSLSTDADSPPDPH